MAKRKGLSKKRRFMVFRRDLFTCQYCGRTPPDVSLEVDHIIPVSKGGTNADDNLRTACFDCNRGKGDHSAKRRPQTEWEWYVSECEMTGFVPVGPEIYERDEKTPAMRVMDACFALSVKAAEAEDWDTETQYYEIASALEQFTGKVGYIAWFEHGWPIPNA